MNQEENIKAEITDESETVSAREKINKPKEWIVTPSLVWNITELKSIRGSFGEVICMRLWSHIRTVLITIGISVPFLILSSLLAIAFSIVIAELKWIGYCYILAISFLSIYLGQNSALKEQLRLRSDIQTQLIRICDIYNIHNQYSNDIEKGWMGAEMLGLSLLTFFPYKATLFTAYAIVIFVEQLSNAGCPLGWLNQLFGNISGIKYVAVAFLAIDRAITLLKVEKDNISSEFGLQNRTTRPAYEPIFLQSHFYLLDYYMTKLTSGQILVAEIDEHSLAYQAGVRKFDIITSINGMKSIITTLQQELKEWHEGNTPLVLELITNESNYQKSLKISF